MKKVLSLLALVVVSSFAMAQQGRLFTDMMFGNISLVPAFGLSANVSVGLERVLGGLDGRASFSLSTSGGGTAFGMGAEVLYPVRVQGGTDLNFGGGLGLQTGSTTVFFLQFLAGAEFPVAGNVGMRLEATPVVVFRGGGSDFLLNLTFGPRIYFR